MVFNYGRGVCDVSFSFTKQDSGPTLPSSIALMTLPSSNYHNRDHPTPLKNQEKKNDTEMEETMMMVTSSSPENPRSSSSDPITCPAWKLYENPYFKSQHQCLIKNRDLPRYSSLSARSSFRDLTFSRSVMESELEFARAQIVDLKAELDYERKTRWKLESMNKRLAKDVDEERRGREAMERVCQELVKEISSDKAKINRMKREMEEERKMLRMAEVLREERLQMKLSEAKILLEEKLSELEDSKEIEKNNPYNEQPNPPSSGLVLDHNTCLDDDNRESRKPKTVYMPLIQEKQHKPGGNHCIGYHEFTPGGSVTRFVLGERAYTDNDKMNATVSSSATFQCKASPEPENPHIKRGIKGFVEFPRVVRAMGSRRSKHWGTKAGMPEGPG